MDRSVALRAGLLQAASVAALSLALGLALPHSFFADWGWLVGPAAWAGCAVLTARMLRLPLAGTLVGAALAAVPSVFAVAIGLHWLGAVLGVIVFALWCGRLRIDRDLPAEIV